MVYFRGIIFSQKAPGILLGFSFSAKKAPGILLGFPFSAKKASSILSGFSFGFQRAQKVYLWVFNSKVTSYQKLAA